MSNEERRAKNAAKMEANRAIVGQFKPGMIVRLGASKIDRHIVDVDHRLGRVQVQSLADGSRRWTDNLKGLKVLD